MELHVLYLSEDVDRSWHKQNKWLCQRSFADLKEGLSDQP